ncbi:mechanosensitive ion channel domain-containing protein [Mobilicoccus caccae]|uniref:Mechanosensitive ion channel MscS domain-containing protein n=1 Tax=Mobilicoccus caccae TaxID=1859295 RepID=A0ABQ6IVP0_9MICO|nr:mechanosensitive ion channel domain-containing protein [Mobilicoccus caccae]GMA41967.1 hypothetical protein GCM10025883_40120 [Mobilicoccus caccae]
MIALDLPPVTLAGAGLGLATVGAGVLVSFVLRAAVRSSLLWRGRGPASADVFGRLAGWLAVLIAVLAALTIVFPSVKPVDILGGVGVVSIAAGIAFQTVLGNMFAGIVLLARDRFRVGDQIAVADHRGTIVSMGLTSSSIRTFDGRLVLIPNAVLHSEVVTVQTGFEQVRTTVGLDVDDATDLRRACRVAEEAMRAEPLVLDEPAPVPSSRRSARPPSTSNSSSGPGRPSWRPARPPTRSSPTSWPPSTSTRSSPGPT